MTNKEKLYKELSNIETLIPKDAIEEIEEDDILIEVKPTIYVCPVCKKEIFIYGDMVDGECLKCNQKLIKKTMQ